METSLSCSPGSSELRQPRDPHPHKESEWPLSTLPSPHSHNASPPPLLSPEVTFGAKSWGSSKGTWKTMCYRARMLTSGVKVAGTEGTFWSYNLIDLCPPQCVQEETNN